MAAQCEIFGWGPDLYCYKNENGVPSFNIQNDKQMLH